MRLPRGFHWRIILVFAAFTALTVAGAALSVLDFLPNASTATQERIVLAFLIAGVIVVALLLVLAVILGYMTRSSISKLAESARRVTMGGFDHRAGVSTDSATRDLAYTMNRMSTTLRDIIRDLSGERDKISAVLDTMADGVLVVEAGGRITLINPAAIAMLGLRSEDTEQRDFGELLRDPDLRSLVAQCQRTGERQSSEMDLLQAAQFIPVSIIATPLPGATSPDVLLTIHDLRMLRQLESTRREFVSNVSHELRSPLASIRLMTESLEDGALEDEAQARNFLGRIRNEVDRMDTLVEDLLELARLESGGEPALAGSVFLGPVMQAAARRFREEAAHKGVTLTVETPANLQPVRGHEGHLGQVLANVLENALKWTQTGGGIRLWVEQTQGGVRVIVQDTGTGIAPEHLPHIFERFYKADRARRDGGTGLGLAIVKHIVQLYGGEVAASSRLGEGSAISFTVPLA